MQKDLITGVTWRPICRQIGLLFLVTGQNRPATIQLKTNPKYQQHPPTHPHLYYYYTLHFL